MYAMEVTDNDVPLGVATRGLSGYPAALKRLSLGALVISNAFVVVVLCMVAALLIDHTDQGIVRNPLAHPSFISPLAWFYVAFLCVLHSIALAVFLHGFFSDKPAQFRSIAPRRSRCVVVPRQKALFLSALFFPLVALIMFIICRGDVCIQGFPNFGYGGFCVCDKRDLITIEGTPNFLPTELIPPNLKVAFVGDMDTEKVEQVYGLIRDEGDVSAVVLNGDLDYAQEHQAWRQRFERFLGDTPFYVTVGNHDTWTWRDYQEQTREHYLISNTTECRGTIGVREACMHKGLGLLLSGVGSSCGGLQQEHTPFFEMTLQRFVEKNVTWRICIFHMNQRRLQLGNKKDSVGWDKYQACLKHGAMIITSHEHQYGRTHELDRVSEEDIHVSHQVPTGSDSSHAIRVGRGRSFVVLTGIGGRSVRSPSQARISDGFWAANWGNDWDGTVQEIRSIDVNEAPAPTHGAFFCSFHVLGDPRLAHCYMKDILGRLADEFYVRSEE